MFYSNCTFTCLYVHYILLIYLRRSIHTCRRTMDIGSYHQKSSLVAWGLSYFTSDDTTSIINLNCGGEGMINRASMILTSMRLIQHIWELCNRLCRIIGSYSKRGSLAACAPSYFTSYDTTSINSTNKCNDHGEDDWNNTILLNTNNNRDTGSEQRVGPS